jgi:two-component system, LytTR family, sensor kinase
MIKNIIPTPYKTPLFHFILWSIWLYLPLSSVPDEELHDRFILLFSLILTTHVPLFILNTHWLFPKFFRQKGSTIYFGILVLCIIGFSCFHFIMKDWILSHQTTLIPRRNYSPFWNIVPLVFVSAISTGYALLDYISKEEQINQEKQQERLQSELSFLRSQISPHFIFNVLNSIVYLIRSKSDLAETVTIKLSELMRYMLYESGHAQISLQQEVTYLMNYIDLQKIRFEEDVKINVAITGDTSTKTIEPMLMIPFVENAFKHGVGMVQNPEIEVKIHVSPSDLKFWVRNKITSEMPSQKDQNAGIGQANVRRRLELLYPDAHQLTIKTTENGWYEVNLTLQFLDSANYAA